MTNEAILRECERIRIECEQTLARTTEWMAKHAIDRAVRADERRAALLTSGMAARRVDAPRNGYDDAAHAKDQWDYDPEGRYAVHGRGVSWLSWLEKVSER